MRLAECIVELGDTRVVGFQLAAQALRRRDQVLPALERDPAADLFQSDRSAEARRIAAEGRLRQEGGEPRLGRGGVPELQGRLGAQEAGLAAIRIRRELGEQPIEGCLRGRPVAQLDLSSAQPIKDGRQEPVRRIAAGS